MDLLHPFGQPKPSEEELIQQDRDYSQQQNLIAGAMHPNSGEADMMQLEAQQQRADLVKWQQDLTEEAQQMIHDLKREVQVGDNVWARLPGEKPLANDKFILDLLSFARPYLSKNLMMSNYTEDRILRNLRSTVWSLRCHLLDNRELYEIQKTDMEYIVRLFKNTIDATPFRSLNNGERRHLGTIGKRMEIHTDRPEVKKKTLFGG